MLRPAHSLRALSLATLALVATLTPAARAEGSDLCHTRPAERISTVGTLRVERFGRGPRAILLVPGLGCGTWVWRDTIEAFKDGFTIYAVTLPGADGTPVVEGPQLDRAVASLAALVEGEHLIRPIVVGHSLGGHLALRLAAEHPGLVAGVVTVDGLPVLPPLAAATSADERRAMAAPMVAYSRGLDEAGYAKFERAAMGAMITDPAVADAATKLVLRSDRTTMLAEVEEMASADLRPLLPKITAPVMVLMPVPSPSPDMPENMRSMTQAQLERLVRDTYTPLFAATHQVTIRAVRGSRHFVMLDQPKAFLEALAEFASSLSAGAK